MFPGPWHLKTAHLCSERSAGRADWGAVRPGDGGRPEGPGRRRGQPMPSGGGIRIIALTSVESPTARPHALISLQGHLPPGAGQGRGVSAPQEFPSLDTP